jgi:SHS2 domain-containing protein
VKRSQRELVALVGLEVVPEVDVVRQEDLVDEEAQGAAAEEVLDSVHEEALVVVEAHQEVEAEVHQEVAVSLLAAEGSRRGQKHEIGQGVCFWRSLGKVLWHRDP